MNKNKNTRVVYWSGFGYSGTMENGKLELDEESKLKLAKENNRRLQSAPTLKKST